MRSERVMKTRPAIARIDAMVLVVCLVFLLLTLGAVGKGGRERAKRQICLNNLKQLTAAWIMYADENNDKLVNGSQGFNKNCATGLYGVPPPLDCPPWVGYQFDWIKLANACRSGTDSYAEEKQKAMLKGPSDTTDIPGASPPPSLPVKGTNLLYKYCPNIGLFRCPNAEQCEMLNYAIVDAMAGAAANVAYLKSSPTNPLELGPPILRRSEIRSPGERFVFVDEGRISPDSWTIRYDKPRWHDMPPCRHGNGTNWSFADGHVEFYKWTKRGTPSCGMWGTIDLCEASPAVYVTFTDCQLLQPCNEDLEWVQIHAWGEFGYDPNNFGCD
jgi:prepilin-type processing-associated H-X9-DG protein